MFGSERDEGPLETEKLFAALLFILPGQFSSSELSEGQSLFPSHLRDLSMQSP